MTRLLSAILTVCISISCGLCDDNSAELPLYPPIPQSDVPQSDIPQSEAVRAEDSRNAEQDRLSDLQRQKMEILDRLRRQADRLARTWKDSQQRQPPADQDSASAEDAATDEAEQTAVGESGMPAESTEKPPNGLIKPPIPVPDASSTESESDLNTAGGDATEPAQSQPQPAHAALQNVVDGPIDRIALATSLFATGQYPECLSILDETNIAPEDSEGKDWAAFLRASCHRKQGKFAEAESEYRDLLSAEHAPWISAASLWWLDHMSEYKSLVTQIKDVKTTAAAWKAEIDVLRNAD